MKPELAIHTEKRTTVNNAVIDSLCWIKEYEKIKVKYPEKAEVCEKLIARAKRAAELCEIDKEQDFAELDGDFPLGDAKMAEFGAYYFTIDQLALMQAGLLDEVHTGYYVEPAYDVLTRKGFIYELKGNYKEARRYYNGDPLPDDMINERIRECNRKAPPVYCAFHPLIEAQAVCAECGKQLCSMCKEQIYSRAEESGIAYCKECYKKALKYFEKFGRY